MPYKYTYDCPIKLVKHFLESKGVPDEIVKLILTKTITKTKVSGFIADDGIYYKNVDAFLTQLGCMPHQLDELIKSVNNSYKKHTDFALEALEIIDTKRV